MSDRLAFRVLPSQNVTRLRRRQIILLAIDVDVTIYGIPIGWSRFSGGFEPARGYVACVRRACYFIASTCNCELCTYACMLLAEELKTSRSRPWPGHDHPGCAFMILTQTQRIPFTSQLVLSRFAHTYSLDIHAKSNPGPPPQGPRGILLRTRDLKTAEPEGAGRVDPVTSRASLWRLATECAQRPLS